MKTIALALFTAAFALAQSTAPDATSAPKGNAKAASISQNKKSAPAQKAKAQGPDLSVPAGAKLVEPNHYRFTDSNGKTWNYRLTPFGVSKWEEPSGSASQPVNESAQSKREPIVVTDLGDSYKFERETPFGKSSWVRKKSELSDEEKVLAGVGPAQSNPSNAENQKPAEKQ